MVWFSDFKLELDIRAEDIERLPPRDAARVLELAVTPRGVHGHIEARLLHHAPHPCPGQGVAERDVADVYVAVLVVARGVEVFDRLSFDRAWMSVGRFFGCPVVDLVGVPASELVRPFARAAAVVGQRAELAVYVDREVDVLPLRIDLQAADPVGACRAEDRAVVAVDLAVAVQGRRP